MIKLALFALALAVASGAAPTDGFTTLEAAAAFLGVPASELGKQTPAATGAELHWSNKLPASMWQPCSHTFCKMEKRKCTINKHPNNGGYWQTGHWCPETMTMRVYHNGRENMGRAHHCHVPSHQNDGKCVCECAHESVLDRLGDMFSGLTTAAASQCAHPSVWGAGQKCSGAELAANPKGLTAERVAERYRQNELGVHKDDPKSPHFCQYLCEDLGASCVRFNKATGKCQCFAGAAKADAAWGAGDVVDAACKASPEMAHVHDMSAALHWYEESGRFGSSWGKKRAKALKQFKTLHGSWHK